MVTDGLEETVAGQASRTIKTARAADRKAMTVISLLYNTSANEAPSAPSAQARKYEFQFSAPPATGYLNDLSSSASDCSGICGTRLVCDEVEVKKVAKEAEVNAQA